MISTGPFVDEPGYDQAVSLDADDAIASLRNEFVIADPAVIYLDGNSLGRLPAATPELVRSVVSDEWGDDLIGSWTKRWWTLGLEMGRQLAPIIGADSEAVVVADSTSINLFKLLWAALEERPDRQRIVTDDMNFPTDLYVMEAAARAAGGRSVDVIGSADGIHGPVDGIIDALDSDVALLTLSHVTFKSGYLYDIAQLTEAAHDVGAMVLWDLSHSAGVVPIDLGDVDMAVGCTYKYLNGGPGSPAFLYVNPALSLDNPLFGWWGHARPFDFRLDYQPAPGIAQFQTGTMPILSLAAIEPALELVNRAGVQEIRDKSLALSEYLMGLADEVLVPLGFELASPRSDESRGSHVSLRHPDAWRVVQAMINDGLVIPDFREPDNIRLGLAPLYVGFRDVHSAVHRTAALLRGGYPDRYHSDRSTVT